MKKMISLKLNLTLSLIAGLGVLAAQPARSQDACGFFKSCLKKNPNATVLCVREALYKGKLTQKKIEGQTAKDMNRMLRRAGFVDVENSAGAFTALPDGAILILDEHHPIRDKHLQCPMTYGSVHMKCGDKWVDTKEQPLAFNFERKCRTKGIWIPANAELKPPATGSTAKDSLPASSESEVESQ